MVAVTCWNCWFVECDQKNWRVQLLNSNLMTLSISSPRADQPRSPRNSSSAETAWDSWRRLSVTVPVPQKRPWRFRCPRGYGSRFSLHKPCKTTRIVLNVWNAPTPLWAEVPRLGRHLVRSPLVFTWRFIFSWGRHKPTKPWTRLPSCDFLWLWMSWDFLENAILSNLCLIIYIWNIFVDKREKRLSSKDFSKNVTKNFSRRKPQEGKRLQIWACYLNQGSVQKIPKLEVQTRSLALGVTPGE